MHFYFLFIFATIFLSDYIGEISGLAFLDQLAGISSLIMFMALLVNGRAKCREYSQGFFVFLLIYLFTICLVGFNSILASSYELYKLLTFLIFFPLISILTDQERVVAAKAFLKVVTVFFSINFMLMLAQVAFGEEVISYVGMSPYIYESSQKSGRYMGFFTNLPSLSLSAACVFVFVDRFGKLLSLRLSNYLKIISGLTVLLSTSKIAILFLVCYIFINNFRKIASIKSIALSVVGGFLAIYFLSQDYRFENKIDQIILLFENYGSSSNLSLGEVDWRFYCLLLAVQIFQSNPIGIGLGTWGDYSSVFNDINYPFPKVIMSDSALSHLIAEQGLVSLLYFLLVAYPLIISKRYCVLPWVVLSLMSFVTTMGFSDSTWPYVFSFCFGVVNFYYPGNYKKDIMRNGKVAHDARQF